MLDLHCCISHGWITARPDDLATGDLPPGVIWIDLLGDDPAEKAFVERTTGLSLPTLEELSEIESSSRLSTEGGALYLNTPIVYKTDSGEPLATPVGFVLTRELLVTVRFKPLTAFTTFKERVAKPELVHPTSAGAFVGLAEALVDRMADVLERVGGELDTVSHRVFRAAPAKKKRFAKPEDGDLQETLRAVGRAGDLASKIRDSLLGIGRIAPYVSALAVDWLPVELKPRLETLTRDIASLNDYDAYLTNKVQFLLDATLGLINIEQNNIIKVLTVVSVVGVPPTFFASMYGMNFKNMPELNWEYGYVYALTLIVVSAIGPYLWFKLRGWL